MPIVYHESSKEFHLYNDKISYIFTILKNGQLGQLYFGRHIRDREDYSHMLELFTRPMAPCTFEDDDTFSLEHIKQEYPSYGSGDMRYPAYEILQENGSRITEMVYQGHRIYHGKETLEGLPSVYAEKEEEVQTLEVFLEDTVIDTKIVLRYSIYEEFPIIARSVKFIHHGEKPIVLNRAMSMSLDLPDKNYEMMELTGAWARERSVKMRKLEHGIQGIYSMRGCSSGHYNPFLALKRENATEVSGEVYGYSLIYSGNFLAQAEVDTYDVTRITMGIHPDCFSWKLKKGESFTTPEAIMAYSECGLNGMSQAFHTLYRTRLARGHFRDKERPILINNWEATYFDFNEDKILKLANKAKSVGIELFVLDDGWFGKRNDDTSSLGDWYPNLNKLPNGIAHLAKSIESLGMKFGMWFEPEMVNKNSDLYQEHPDWILSTPNRRVSVGRHQYVLDFSKEEVVDYIYQRMESILSDAPISYIKWDMNRCMSEVYSHGAPPEEQGKIMHKHILGVYRLYERLTKAFPHILFESCAGGGNRFDPGMLYYAPQCWTSDNTDAAERIKIQYGTSMVYPISSMGAHVSAVPNHQTLRNTPLNTRANTAYFGTFGYELDLNKLTEEELSEIKEQVQFMKEHRRVLQQGRFYRLLSPFEGNTAAWMVVSEDKKEAIVGYYRIFRPVNSSYERLKLQGLDENLLYQVSIVDKELYGDELMVSGLLVSDSASGETREAYTGRNGDYHSRIYVLYAK